eukprot:IDg14792t1
MWPAARLSKLVQTDNFEAMSYTFPHTFAVFCTYVFCNRWYYADVEKSSNVDTETRWDGNAKFPDRDVTGKPLNQAAEAGFRQVSLIRTTKSRLEVVPRRLIGRLGREFINYGAMVTNNQLLFKHMEYKARSKAALIEALKDICSEILRKTDDQITAAAAPVAPANNDDSEDDDDDIFRAVRKRQATQQRSTGGNSDTDPVTAEVERFFESNYINWKQQLSANGVSDGLVASLDNNPEEVQKNWPTIAKHFDPMQYWETTGKAQFPHIYWAACLYLALPDSNGHQERTFSAATWMDGKLNNRQTDATFEM